MALPIFGKYSGVVAHDAYYCFISKFCSKVNRSSNDKPVYDRFIWCMTQQIQQAKY